MNDVYNLLMTARHCYTKLSWLIIPSNYRWTHKMSTFKTSKQLLRTPEIEGMCIFPGCTQTDFADVPNAVKINFLCRLNFLISPGTRVCSVHSRVGEDAWTEVFVSHNNRSDFDARHAQNIADLLRFSLDMVHGAISTMLFNVVE